ncbi:helix-turn-helix transcriptional regulator [Yoonia sp.]|nr:helix-turn-helix transcriptional regulator [Yoonia sp.]
MNEMVTIPKDEYLRLKALEEDFVDLQSVSEILQRLEGGEEELIPAAIVDQLLEGEQPLAIWRQHRGLTQAELARRSGVNRVQIIDIEARRKTGSVETLRKLALALDVDIDDLVTVQPVREDFSSQS